eukprot:936161-Pelagomonas_calceolata.AAC.1
MLMGIWGVAGREGKGYIAVPASGGSLAEAKHTCNQTSCWKHPAPEPGYEKKGMKSASKVIGALVVECQLLKLVKGVLSVASPTNTQKSACCLCAASNCCPRVKGYKGVGIQPENLAGRLL